MKNNIKKLALILFLLNKNFLIFGKAINQNNSFNKIKTKIKITQDKNETIENENDDKSQNNDKKKYKNQKQNNSLNQYKILNNVDNTTKKTKPTDKVDNRKLDDKKSKFILKNIKNNKQNISWWQYILIFIIVIIILPVMFYKIYKSFKSFKLDINIKTPTKDLTISYHNNGKINKNIKFFKNKKEFDFVEKFIDSPLFKEFVKKNLSIKEARDNEEKKQDDFFDILKKYDKNANKKFTDTYDHLLSFSNIQYIYLCTNNAKTIKIQFIYTILQHGNEHIYEIAFSNLQNELIYQINIINFNKEEFTYKNHTKKNNHNFLQSFYCTDDGEGLSFYYNGKILDIRHITEWKIETDKNFIESIVLNSFKKIEKIMETTYNKQFFTNEKQ